MHNDERPKDPETSDEPETPLVYDAFAKEAFGAVLEYFGRVERQRPISVWPQHADLWFEPDPSRRPLPHPLLPLIARMAQTPALFEPFSTNPNLDQMLDVITQSGILHRQRRPKPYQTTDAPYTKARTWLITPGEPRNALAKLGARPDTSVWGPGFYVLPEAFDTTIIVVRLLPRTQTTVLLRLLGRGRTLERAIDDLTEMFPDRLVMEVTQAIHRWLQAAELRRAESQELDMITQELIEQSRRLWEHQRALDHAEGVVQGRAEGVVHGRVATLLVMLDERFGADQDTWAKLLAGIDTPEQLDHLVRITLSAANLQEVLDALNTLHTPDR
ncbi:MAG: hypothetical protein AAFS10_01490 [Myxococcota bacterium]